jgi:hypothetical protein
MQSVPITTEVVSSNPAHAEVYSIQDYVIKFVSDLWQVGIFSGYYGFFLPPRYNWNIVESCFKGILKLILVIFCISWKLAIGSINDIYETLTRFL